MNEELEFSADPARVDLSLLSSELTQTYWGGNRTKEKLKRIIENCFVMSVFKGSRQIGFGRVVTDYETFAYVMDVIITESQRGKGYGTKLMQEIFNHPRMRKIEAYTLRTVDAGKFYEDIGFKLETVERYVLKMKDRDNQPSQTTPASAAR